MSTPNAPTETETVIMGAKISVDQKAELRELARRRERNISQELRIALGEHLRRNRDEVAPTR